MRILHGVSGAANQPATVSKLQRAAGVEARCISVSEGDGFGYPADIKLQAGSDVQESYSDFLRTAIDEYDVFHFYFRSFFFFDPRNNAFPSGLDLLLLRAAGKTVVVHYRGSEVREASKFKEFSPYNYVAENPSGIFSKFREPSLSQRVDFVRSVANVVLVPDEELASYVPGSRIVRRAIDLDDFAPVPHSETTRPLVIHAPSRRVVKGTDSILEAVQQLRDEGLEFDFELIENLPHSEAKALYSRADVVIDQVRIGWFGVLALEGMALQKCVLAYVRDDLLHHLGEAPPLVPTNPVQLADDLRAVIESQELRREVAERGRRYIEEHHDATQIAQQLIDLYASDEVASRAVDPGGVLDYLIVQRNDTKNMYRKKFSVISAVKEARSKGDFVAEFRRIQAKQGLAPAIRRTAQWAYHRGRAKVRHLR